MSTTLDITIPYNGGSIGSVTEQSLKDGDGNHYTWIGGNNGRKFVSVRVQSNPDFIIFNVFEADDLKSSSMQLTTLSSQAFPETTKGHSVNLRLCRLNSNTVLVKHYGGVTLNSSTLIVVEVDESDNSVAYYDVTPTDNTDNVYLTNGGRYSPSSSAGQDTGRGMQQFFMQQIKENNIVTFESIEQHSNINIMYTFCQKTWDPVAKTLTAKIITPSDYNSTLPQGVTTPFNANSSHHIVLDYNNYLGVADVRQPVLHGSYNQVWGGNWESQGYSFYLNSVDSRDGKIHFSLGWKTTLTQWQSAFVDRSDSKYVMTYDPSDDSWTTTSRYATNGHTLANGRQDFGIWLPLNTVNSKEHLTANNYSGSIDSFDDKQLHAKTWIVVGAKSARVVGAEPGSECVISNSNNSSDDAFQAMWLDEDHFIVFWGLNVTSYNVVGINNSVKYTVVRYYDEHFMESVSEGTINADSYTSYLGQPLFRKVDDYTLISDAFSRVVTFWAPEA